MIEVGLSAKIRIRERNRAEDLGELNGTYSDDGKCGVWHNYIGNLGEAAWLMAYPDAESCFSYDYDVVYKGSTFEIKTKPRSVPPQPYFSCNVQARNDTQDADYYGFVSLLKNIAGDFEKAYVVGYISTRNFRSICRFNPAGTLFKNTTIPSRYDDWEVRIEELEAPESLRVARGLEWFGA